MAETSCPPQLSGRHGTSPAQTFASATSEAGSDPHDTFDSAWAPYVGDADDLFERMTSPVPGSDLPPQQDVLDPHMGGAVDQSAVAALELAQSEPDVMPDVVAPLQVSSPADADMVVASTASGPGHCADPISRAAADGESTPGVEGPSSDLDLDTLEKPSIAPSKIDVAPAVALEACQGPGSPGSFDIEAEAAPEEWVLSDSEPEDVALDPACAHDAAPVPGPAPALSAAMAQLQPTPAELSPRSMMQLRLQRRRQAVGSPGPAGSSAQTLAVAVAHVVTPMAPPLPAPVPDNRNFRGISWWLDPLKQALAARCPKFGQKLVRRVVHHALCAGSGAEYVGMEALQLDVGMAGAADADQTARRFLARTWPQLRHLYESNAAFLEPGSFCIRCESDCKGGDEQVDMSSGGCPCQPWSLLRQQNGITPATGAPWEHPAYTEFTQGLAEYLEKRRPHASWAEEVDKTLRIDLRTGETYLAEVIRSLRRLGYAIAALLMQHIARAQVSR